MFPMLELTAVDGQPLDIPLSTVFHVQGLNEGENEKDPTARAFLRYQMGRNTHQLVVATDADEIVRLMNIHGEPTGKWLLTTQKENGERLLIPAHRICVRQGLVEGGTYISYYLDDECIEIESATVAHSRDDLVKLVTPKPAPVVEPAAPRPRKSRPLKTPKE